MTDQIMNKRFFHMIAVLFTVELVSLFGHMHPAVEIAAFSIVVLSALVISLHRLEYGIYLLISELIIGSFGYLLSWDLGGVNLSLRIALWLIIMSVWLGGKIVDAVKYKKFEINFLQSAHSKFFIWLALFIVWGGINGFIHDNNYAYLVADGKRWLYLLIILPVYDVFLKRKNLKSLYTVILASCAWLSFKTIWLLYVFSHNFQFLHEIYKWVRDTGAGEVTLVQDGFYRIFMQSHIYILFMLFFLVWSVSISYLKNKPPVQILFLSFFSVIAFSVVLISFSRSFWVGSAAGSLWMLFIIFYNFRNEYRKIFRLSIIYLLIICSGALLAAAIVKFPLPKTQARFGADLISERASDIKDEAGASSRWNLLPKLWTEITHHPLLGSGFGSVVTYQSNDPRVLLVSSQGVYTTYTFEWGWLEVWMKLGIGGLAAYLLVIAALFKRAVSIFNLNQSLSVFLSTALLILAIVNFFTPYINHPIGIGMIVLAAILLDQYSTDALSASCQ